MALWIRVTEDTVVTTEVSPAHGKAFTLEELHRMVGGYIEAVYLRDGSVMWVNEDGKRLELPYNPPAHLIAIQQAGTAADDYIVGNVVIASRAESGEDDAVDD